MVDVILDTPDIRVLGGPSVVDLELDFGRQGARGSNIYAGFGKPSPTTLPSGYQIKDLYINLDPDDDEYSCIYQYTTTVVDDIAINEWVLLLRISPATLSINATLEFTAGTTEYIIPIDNYFPEDVLQQISEQNVNIQLSFNGTDPIASSIASAVISTIQNPPKTILTITINAVSFDGTNWTQVSGNVNAHMLVGLGVDATSA